MPQKFAHDVEITSNRLSFYGMRRSLQPQELGVGSWEVGASGVSNCEAVNTEL